MVEIENLFVLSDVTQMELFVSSAGKISGKMQKMVQISEIGLKINLTPEVVSSRATDDVIALVIKVHGSLYTAAIHDRKTAMVTVMVLDQSKIADRLVGFFEGHEKTGIGPLLNLLAKAQVASATKSEYGETWTPRKAA